ncbi:MAG: EamA family transporter [Candidatus Peregrinibacteria bacterium]|nr:EamA family transporter [Candidatus Peregrinibacteria bacterium]
MDHHTRGLLEIHIASFILGFVGIIGKFLTLTPVQIVFGRVLFASLALFVLLRIAKIPLRLHSRKDALSLLFLGVLLPFHWFCFFQSVYIASVAIGIITFAAFPVFVVLFDPLFSRTRIRMKELIIACITLFGVSLVAPSLDISSAATQATLWGLGSACTFAILSILNRQHVARYPSLLVAFYQDAVAVLVLLPFILVSPPTVGTQDLLLLILLGTVCTAGGHSLLIKGMRYVRAQTASIITTLETVYGLILAALIFGDIPTPRMLIGGIIILAMAIVSSAMQHSELVVAEQTSRE